MAGDGPAWRRPPTGLRLATAKRDQDEPVRTPHAMDHREGPTIVTEQPQLLPPAEPVRTGAIVLVHGAWVGEWSWLPVEADLRVSGRAVHAVSLTGHGTRRHQSGPDVNLEMHVADVVNLVQVLDLSEITLVGHSYGGRVITGACNQLADRVAALVYVDAHAPVAEDPGQPAARVQVAKQNGGMLPFPDDYSLDPELMGQAGVEWFRERLMPQSFACLTDPWLQPLPDGPSKTFIFASGYQPTRFAQYAEHCRNDQAWTYHEIDGPHFLMLSHPNEVASIILEA